MAFDPKIFDAIIFDTETTGPTRKRGRGNDYVAQEYLAARPGGKNPTGSGRL
jgi:hypothetical protein